ncbi:MAG: DUF3108 domain-containing protein [Bergeyella zoohelcum]|nr:DUF3108 domain-containing protein [Bergeyella zoohelcum]
MKKILNIIGLLAFALSFAQLENIKAGESLHYRIHYGFLNAGTATLSTQKVNYNGLPHLYVKGVGKTSGAVRTFFKVEDLYESYIDLKTGLPSFYVRNVYEGGYTQHFNTIFNHTDNTLILKDKENPKNAPKKINTVKGIQDMLSAFYHLRSLDDSELKVGKVIKLNIWIDDEMFPFQLKIDGLENVATKYGKVNCFRIKPMVMSGRVFKAKEGVTMWITNDKNRVPVAIKAELLVGSLKASLDNYSNLMYPINFKK